eukprot:91913_1
MGTSTKYYWGAPDSLINWCEKDYVTDGTIIAEFWNSWSNLFFIASGLMALRLAFKHKLPITFTITSVAIVFTGLFSFFFHASLRYWMQKLDESFETVLLLGIFHSFDSCDSFMYAHMIFAVIGILFIEKWFCEIHLILIALLTFVQLYRLGWTMLKSLDIALYYHLFGWIRNYFLIAGISWLVDRVACDYLYDLPYEIANPQLHAFGWHLFCALGLNQTMITLCIMHKLHHQKPQQMDTNTKETKRSIVSLKKLLHIPYDIDIMSKSNITKTK